MLYRRMVADLCWKAVIENRVSETVELCIRLLKIYAWLKSSENHTVQSTLPRAGQAQLRELHRQIKCRFSSCGDPQKVTRQYSNHRYGSAGKSHVCANDVGSGVKSILPRAVTQYSRPPFGRASWRIIHGR